jgi:hypothetical protein
MRNQRKFLMLMCDPIVALSPVNSMRSSAMSHNASDCINGLLLGLAAGERIGGPICMALQLTKSLSSAQ